MYAIMNCGVAALLIFCGVSFAGAASVVALYAMGVYFIISGFRWFISDGKDPNRTGYQTESIKMSIIFAAISWGLAALCFWLAKGIADYENMLGLAVAVVYIIIGISRFRGCRKEPYIRYVPRVSSILGIFFPIAYIAAGVLAFLKAFVLTANGAATAGYLSAVLVAAGSAMWIVRSVFIIKEN